MLTFGRCALLCVILGAHLLLLFLISVNDKPRSVRKSGEAPGILFFVDLPEPNDTQPSAHRHERDAVAVAFTGQKPQITFVPRGTVDQARETAGADRTYFFELK